MNAIVTGASRGIGRATAEAFAQEGCDLMLCARSASGLFALRQELKTKFPQRDVHVFPTDLSVKENAAAFGHWCLERGEPDVLVNNAGSYRPGNVMDEPGGTLESLLQLNLFGAYYLTRVIGTRMKQNKHGHIFNISSIAGTAAYDGGGSYSISKYALNGFNANLRHELKNFNVKVTNVLPGAVFTDSWAGFDNSHRRIMEAGDIAKAIVSATKLSAQAVVEEIVIRPQLGDL